jgi:hypothetical protein
VSPIRPARPRVAPALLAVVAGLVSGFGLTRATAGFSATTGSAASFGSAACYERATVQRGTATSTADGVTSVTISSVNTARAFLMFTTRSDSNRPVGSVIGGRLASSTSLEFLRDTDEISPVTMTIEWSVVEYACGVNVQRGSVVQTATTVDVAITPVAATAQAFVLWSKTPHEPDQAWDDNDPVVGDLTSTSNVQFRATALNVNHTIWWQVVEFTDASTINVQRGTTSLTGGVTSTSVTLPSSVNTSRSFALVGTRQPDVNDLASVLVRGRLTGAATLTIDRSAGTYDVDEIGWQVVELLDGSTVQSGTATVSSSVLTTDVAITAVTLARTSAFVSTQNGAGQSGGRTTYTADDVLGVASFGLTLTSTTNLHIARDNAPPTSGSSSVAWFVVSWGLP